MNTNFSRRIALHGSTWFVIVTTETATYYFQKRDLLVFSVNKWSSRQIILMLYNWNKSVKL
jgi:hypothetical protein